MSFLQRLEKAASGRQRGMPQGVTRVLTADLKDLIFHFKRLDAEAYARHQQKKAEYKARKRPSQSEDINADT